MKNKPQTSDEQLDITYVCPRILAMSFPINNNTQLKTFTMDVASFLQQRHMNDYQIYNLSHQQYDQTCFEGKVFSFPWEDKACPNLAYLFMLCKHIDDFLSSKLSNVVALHCISGRGRTGVAICCYLMYCGRFSSSEEALFYFGKQRGSIILASQIRYVQYFEKLLKQTVYPTLKYITSIVIHGIPNIQDGQCKPFIEIISLENSQKQLKYTDKTSYKNQKKAKDLLLKDIELIRINIAKAFYVIGDVILRINHNGQIESEQLFRIPFNTAFIEDNKLSVRIEELDPTSILKDERYPADLRVEIQFREFCNCTNEIQFNQRCKSCQSLSNSLCKEWNIIQNILNDYTKHTVEESQILLFGDVTFDNLNEIKYQTFTRAKQSKIQDDDDC